MTTLERPPDGFDALRADGGPVHIRTIRAGDLESVQTLHAGASDRSNYLRFFSVSRNAADDYLPGLIEPTSDEHHALVAIVAGEIVGVASYESLGTGRAEFALLVADKWHHDGIGTLLIEHLACAARQAGIHAFVAETLTENSAMTRVLHDLGYPMDRHFDHGTATSTFDLRLGVEVITAIGDREREADSASLRPLLEPQSIAVIGASSRPGSVGYQVLSNILRGGFTGAVYVVNPKHASVLGVPSVASPTALPEPPDLAVVAVPAARVPDVVRACGERGARAVLLLGSGFGEAGAAGAALQGEVLLIARTYGMRIVGPNCIGVVNTDPGVQLNATFADVPTPPGPLGLVSQSGAFGVAFLAIGARAGLGISEFVSVGNKSDVSGNDLLLAWEDDPRTRVIAMYLESIGDARRFARIARRVSSSKPILAIKSGRTSAGRRAGQSHTAAAATAEVAVDALFTEAGVLRVSTTQDMLDAARVLAEQSLPAGPRVVIVGNSGGPGILAADAAVAAGLDVVQLNSETEDLLRRAVPTAASTQNPIDLGASVGAEGVRSALRALLDADVTDAILTVFTEITSVGGGAILAAVVAAAALTDKPVVATQVGAAQRSVPLPGTTRALPVFTFPESAAAALGVAHRYSRVRAEIPAERVPLTDVDTNAARTLVATAVASGTEWLSPEDVARLLACYGIRACPQRVVAGVKQALAAATELGYPVVLKAVGPIHKSDVDGVRLDLRDEPALRRAVSEIEAAVPLASDLLLQPMMAGTELVVGAVQDAHVGPMVMLGAGGVLVDILDDRTFRLAPLAPADADAMISCLRTARLLDGYRNRPVVSRSAVCDVVVRVAQLASDLPDVAELDLNPLSCRSDGAAVVDARIRIVRATPKSDPLSRQLRAAVFPTTGAHHDK